MHKHTDHGLTVPELVAAYVAAHPDSAPARRAAHEARVVVWASDRPVPVGIAEIQA